MHEVNETAEPSKRGRPPNVGVFPGYAPPVPKTLNDAVKYLAWVVDMVVTGQLDARSAHEATGALKAFENAVAKRDLEREIAQLRAELKAAKGTLQAQPIRGMGIARRA